MYSDFAAGCVHLLTWEVVSSRQHAPGHRLSDQVLNFVQARYCAGPSLTLNKAAQFAHDFFSRLRSGGLAAVLMPPHGSLADDCCLRDNEDWDLSDLLTPGPTD